MASEQQSNDHLPPTGIQGGYQGAKFQLKFVQLFSMKALKKYSSFNVWTEDTMADKFDDMLFSYTSNNQTRYTFLQAKHKMNPIDIGLKNLFDDKSFDLYKYFVSLQKIEENFDIDYKDIDIQDLIIVTNNGFPNQSANDLFLKISESSSYGNKALYFEQQSSHNIFTREGKLFKFDNTKINENLEFLKLKFLLIELMQLLVDRNSENYILKHSMDFLTTNVLNVTYDSIEFKDEFLEDGNPKTEFIRQLFEEALDSASVKIKNNKKMKIQNNFWEYFENSEFNRNSIDEINGFDYNTDKVDEKIKDFIRNLLFVTEINESEVDRSISLEILNIINDASKFNDALVAFTGTIDDWFTNKKSQYNGKKLNNQFLPGIFKHISDNTIFQKSKLEFANPSTKLKEFLNSTSDTLDVLINEVPRGETFWGCLKLYRMKSSLIYLNSQMEDSVFEVVFNTLKHASNEYLLVIEDTVGNASKLIEFIKNVKETSKAKVVIVCEQGTVQSFKGYANLIDKELFCQQLTNESVASYLEKFVVFQGTSTQLKNLIDSKQLENIPLKELKDLMEIGEAPKEPEYYLPRTLVKQIHLKEEILKELPPTESLVYTESDYNSKMSKSSVHLVKKIEKPGNGNVGKIKETNQNEEKESPEYMWIKSSRHLKYMRPHVHEEKTQVNIAANPNQVNIVRDIAGMGKSVFFAHLSVELKRKFGNCWVQKIDLQSYSKELKKFEDDKIDEKNKDEVLNFFSKNFMKAGDIGILNVIFKNFIVSGRSIFLFDGFDEIKDSHKETILTIISTLRKTSSTSKIFISTRPEWAEKLEDQFTQFSHFFEPFTSEDQQNFMLKIWAKDTSWKDVAKDILFKLNKSITDHERSFTGIPLITKLAADFFSDKIRQQNKAEKLIVSDYTFYELLENFTKKKFKIFLVEKLKIKESYQIFQRTYQFLKVNHQKLAMKLLFPACAEQFYSSLDELDEQNWQDFIDCGLVELVNGQLRFHHQIFAEFLATTCFEEYFDNPKLLKFLFEIVLVENGYQMIRSLINYFIVKKANIDQTKSIIKNFIEKDQSVLIIAAKEQNFWIFKSFFEISCEDIDQNELRKLLLQRDADNCNLLSYLLKNCERKDENHELWRNVVKRILVKLDENTPNQNRSITNTPLIADLVADFFPDKIQPEIQVEKLKLPYFVWYELLNYFVSKELKTFLIEKEGIEETHRTFRKTLRVLKLNHQKLALKLLFPTTSTTKQFYSLLDELDDEGMQNFVDYGLVEEVNNQLTFRDQLIPEYLATTYFEEYFDNKKLLKFLFQVALTEKGNQMIRSFINCFIVKKVINDQTKSNVKNLIIDKNLSVLKIAAKESNFDSFEIFLDILCQNTDRNELHNLLLQKDADNSNFIFYLIENCDINLEFLNKISNKVGLDFLKKILKSENGSENLTIMGGAALHGKNYFPLLKWLTDNFSTDFCFIREILLAKDKSGNGILHNAVQKFDKNQFIEFLCELKLLDNGRLLHEMLLELNNKNNSFMYNLIEVLSKSSSEKKSGAFDDIIEVLKSISKNTKVFEELILIGDLPIIHHIKSKFRDFALNFLQFSNELIDLHKLLKSKDKSGQNWLVYMFVDSAKFESVEAACQILNWIKSFDKQLFNDIIFNKNNEDVNFIHQMCRNASKTDLHKILKEMIKYLQQNVSDFDKNKIFKENDIYGDNWLAYMFYNSAKFESVEAACQILDWIKSFDSQLFTDVIFNQNDCGANFIHRMCQNASKTDLHKILKEMMKYLQQNVPDFETNKILKENDMYGDNWLVYMFYNSAKFESAEAARQILNWIKSFDLQLFFDVIFNKNYYGANCIHKMCQNASKKDLPNILKEMINYLQQNVPDFDTNEFLKTQTNYGSTLLNFIFFGAANYESAEAACEILLWIKNIEVNLLKFLIFTKNKSGAYFIHDVCLKTSKTDLPKIFKKMINFLRENIPQFDLNEFLCNKNNDGKTCIDCIDLNDSTSVAKSAKTEISDWLNSIGFQNSKANIGS